MGQQKRCDRMEIGARSEIGQRLGHSFIGPIETAQLVLLEMLFMSPRSEDRAPACIRAAHIAFGCASCPA